MSTHLFGLAMSVMLFVGNSVLLADNATSVSPGGKVLDGVAETESRYPGTVAVWFSSHYQIDKRDWTII